MPRVLTHKQRLLSCGQCKHRHLVCESKRVVTVVSMCQQQRPRPRRVQMQLEHELRE